MHMEKELATIDAWLEATGTAQSRLGLLACANPRAIERIRSGTASVRNLYLVLEHIKRNPA